MQKTNLSLMILCLLVAIGSIAATSTNSNQNDRQWINYRNEKYRYEIRYPSSFEFALTGPQQERDGRQFSIFVKDVASVHGLNCNIYESKTLAQIAQEAKAPSLQELAEKPVESTSEFHAFSWKKIVINGAPAIRGEVRTRDDQQLFMITIIMDHVLFRAHLYSSLFDARMVEDMVSTFRFY